MSGTNRPKVFAINGVIPVIHPEAFVHPDAVLIGDARVGAGCYVGPGASLRGDFGRVELGPGANLQDNCVMHSYPGKACLVERNGHIGHGAVLHGCVVRANALVGMNSVIMDGAELGEWSMVAALSFVKADMVIPPGILAAGVPAKPVRELSEAEKSRKNTGTETYHRLARQSLASLVPCEPLNEVEDNRPELPID